MHVFGFRLSEKRTTQNYYSYSVFTQHYFARGGGAINSICLRKGRMTAVPTTTLKDDDVNDDEMKKK